MVILTVGMGRSIIKLNILNTVMGMGTDMETGMETDMEMGMTKVTAIVESESHRFE